MYHVGDKVQICGEAFGPAEQLGQRGTVTSVVHQYGTHVVYVQVENDPPYAYSPDDLIPIPVFCCPKCDSEKYEYEMADYLCQECRHGL